MRPSTGVNAQERFSLHDQEVFGARPLRINEIAVALAVKSFCNDTTGFGPEVIGVQITTHTHTFAQHWSRTAIFESSYYWCSGSTPKSCLAIMGRSRAQCQLGYLLVLAWWTTDGCDSSTSFAHGHESRAHFNTLGGSILCDVHQALHSR